MTKSIIPPSPSAKEYTRNEVYKAQMKANGAPMFDRDEPMTLFAQWLEDAKNKEENDANAMAVATVDEDGLPDVRMVLLKGLTNVGLFSIPTKTVQRGSNYEPITKPLLTFTGNHYAGRFVYVVM